MTDCPVVTKCGLVFCRDCVLGWVHHEEKYRSTLNILTNVSSCRHLNYQGEREEALAVEKPCPYCQSPIDAGTLVSADAFLPPLPLSKPSMKRVILLRLVVHQR